MIERKLRTLIAMLFLAGSALTYAKGQPVSAPPPVDSNGAIPAMAPVQEADAEQTREKLAQLLRRHPPELGRVLKLDPALMTNASYMAAYPELRAFVAQHPEVTRSPGYYLQSIWIPAEQGPESATINFWMDMMTGLAALLVFGVVTTILVWLVKTILEQRRWSRLSKVQTDVHGKLLDRFTSNDDLLAYMQTSSGKRFLEAAPIPVDVSSPRGVSAPVGRILWSVQAGVVLSTLGVGLQLVSGRVVKELAPPLFVMGVIALSIGIGFALSALVSYFLSRKLGLLEPPEAPSGSAERGSSLA